jgi:hypothetical protein
MRPKTHSSTTTRRIQSPGRGDEAATIVLETDDFDEDDAAQVPSRSAPE